MKISNRDSLCIEKERSDYSTNMISALNAQKLIHKGAETFLAYILDTRTSKQKIDQVSTVREYIDVFLE